MKDGIQKFLKIFLIFAGGILVVLLAFGIVLILDWPWWVGFFLLLFLAGLVLGGFFLRKIWLRRKEQNFINDMSEQDMARLQALSAKEKSDLKDLHAHWKSAIETLRGSHLKKLGNPLYVLPWYMVIGESGSGKTTSLNSARLASPFRDANRVMGVSGTKQCEWWFFEQAVVIDTAGRYTIPVNGGQDKDEWQRFLSLLIKYRRREPLNGLIVTVAADRLLEAGHEELEKDGRIIRQRIDELMRALGVRFPVYVLVTKCDLVQGVNRFCERLPEKSLDQPMGIINQDLSPDADAFVERAVTTIDERLRNLRLHLLHQPETKGADPALLLFPEEFEGLKQGLAVFMSGAFRENPYQETPVLRGLFFSSGRQEGNPHSHFSKAMGLIGEEEALPGTNKGLFLHDFFAKVLPKDRSLLSPTKRSIEWRTLTGNLGLTSWIIIGVAICGLLSFSFVKNLKTIRDISHEFSKSPALRGPSDLVAMDRFRQEILKVEEQNHHWWIPRFGLNESIKVETDLKNRYCRQFQDGFLSFFDKQMSGTVVTISSATPDEIYAQYVIHLARRINILKARLDDKELETLQTKPQPSYISFLNAADPGITPEVKKAFGSLYLYYLIWRTDSGDINKEMTVVQSWLKQLVAVKGANMQWPAVWVNTQSGLPPVTLKDFWGGSLTAPGEKSVPPAFTRKGKETADSLIKEVEAALQDPSAFSAQKSGFAGWYRLASLESWQGFAAGFPRGAERLRGAGEWQQAAAKMATDQGAYFALLNKIAMELEPVVMEAPLPAWLQQVYQYQSAKAQGYAQANVTLAKATNGGKKMLASIRHNVGQDAGAQKLETQMTAARAFQEYRNALAAISPATASRNQAFQLAAQTFGEDPVTSKSPFYSASAAASRLKSGIAAGGATDPMFGQLLSGPLDFLWAYVRWESACQLQSVWEEQVLAGTMGVPSQQAIPALLGPDGLAWRFVKGPAAPFLNRSLYGYRSKETLGGRVPFNNSLFSFMEKGAKTQAAVMAMGKQQNYSVGVKGLPTDANADAGVKPQTTRLELQCGGSSQTLVNNNYPVGKTFFWSPDTCGDVLFQIEVGDVTLTRHYMGPEGFPSFLKDMHGGRRTFSAREFPGEKSALERIGVKFITVNYRFIGSGAILQQTATLSGQAPRSIAQCWTR